MDFHLARIAQNQSESVRSGQKGAGVVLSDSGFDLSRVGVPAMQTSMIREVGRKEWCHGVSRDHQGIGLKNLFGFFRGLHFRLALARRPSQSQAARRSLGIRRRETADPGCDLN